MSDDDFGIVEEDLPETGDPRVPLVLLLDTSYSMLEPTVGSKTRIEELNLGLAELRAALDRDPVASRRVEVLVVTFGGTVQVQGNGGFELARDWVPPLLSASGSTPMGQAVRTGLDLVDQRRREIQRDGLPMYRPWMFLLTDGEATDDVSGVAAEVAKYEELKKVLFWSIATGDANTAELKKFTPSRAVLNLQDNKWRNLFTWVSVVMKSTSQSAPGEQIQIPTYESITV